MHGSRLLLTLLTSCVRQHDWSTAPADVEGLLAQVEQQQLLVAARRHRVVGCVRNSVRHLPGAVDPSLDRQLAEDVSSGLAQHMRALSALHDVSRALADVTSTWAVVKGPVLSAHVYDRSDLRSYKDLDVLVRPSELGAALGALEAAGCTVLDRNWTMLGERAMGELHVLMPTGIIVDLHWSLFNRQALRRSFRAPTDELLDRSVPVDVAGLEVRTLDPLDTVVHLAVHAAMTGGDRLVWFKDLEQGLRHVPDVDALAHRARRWRAQMPVAAMLARTRRLLGAELPDLDLDDLLGSRPWSLVLRAVDARADVAAGGERGSMARLVSRSLRQDGASSALEAGRHVAGWVRKGSSGSNTADLGLAVPGSVLYDSGGDALRRRYLQSVAGWS